MRIVPHPVIYGFVNGLAIIIFITLNQFKDASGNWLTGQSLYILVGLLLTMLIIWLPKLQKLSVSY
jgi:SulP family sulfate permease